MKCLKMLKSYIYLLLSFQLRQLHKSMELNQILNFIDGRLDSKRYSHWKFEHLMQIFLFKQGKGVAIDLLLGLNRIRLIWIFSFQFTQIYVHEPRRA